MVILNKATINYSQMDAFVLSLACLKTCNFCNETDYACLSSFLSPYTSLLWCNGHLSVIDRLTTSVLRWKKQCALNLMKRGLL